MTSANFRHAQRQSIRAQRGLSLVELMVAMTIGLFLMGAVVIIYINTSTTSRSSTQESQMNEDATLALEVLQQQIRLAGFSNVDAAGARLFPGRAVFGCEGTPSSSSDTPFSSLACGSGGSAPDALAVRYEATTLNSQPVTSAAGVTLPGNCANEGISAWNASAEGAASATPITLADNRYFIMNDTDGTPSLFCRGRTGAGFGADTALIPNIEDMQIQYAITALPTTNNPIPHQVAGYVAADDATLGAAAGNWSRVAAIRICLLARTAQTIPTGDNSTNDLGSYVDCNGVVQTRNDRRLRRAYVTTIQLRNTRPGLPSDYALGANPWLFLYEN